MNLIVCDIDDTILPRGDLVLPQEIIDTVNKLLRKGDVICLASGRPFFGVEQYLDEFCDGKKYAITANGAATYDYSGNLISQKTMSIDDLYYIHEKYGKINGVTVYGYDNENSILVFSDDKWTQHELEVNKISKVYDLRKVDMHGSKILLHKVMIAAEKEINEKISLTDEELERFTPTRSTYNYYEILAKDATKLSQLDILVSYINIPKTNVYTFGDNNNDASMIKAYNGIALGNAIDECKNNAKYITKDVKECGVAYAIKNILHLLD